MIKAHSIHIPVMGLSFTIDTPLKVSRYGIDSVISLGDDYLFEKLRKWYCSLYKFPYREISNKSEDYRAQRITAYLNLINTLAKREFEKFKLTTTRSKQRIAEFFEMLPDHSSLKREFVELTSDFFDLKRMKVWVEENLTMGSIDVNVMTKIDKTNFKGKEKLPTEFNDAHAAVRGYANSTLESSIVLSAGLNPRLYGYLQQFRDFHPDKNDVIRKKIILKVSDFRSALIQGKFLAKKGLWVSEYRIESGLNCGGHAFATDGHLLGPILEEFKQKRKELLETVHDIFVQTRVTNNQSIPKSRLPLKVTAQGGVGTAEEHLFMVQHYNLDSVGWGSPFLLVPEATTVDKPTLDKLVKSTERDLYLSNISPLGVPFNSLRGNTKDAEREHRIKTGKPGSPCPKKYLALNTEFTEKGICTASRQYQNLKLKALGNKKLTDSQYKSEYDQIVDKTCICVGLGTSALIEHGMDTKVEGEGVSICPGPNMAYFSRKMSLKQLLDHIYGRSNVITRKDRPHMFVKELRMYISYLSDLLEEAENAATPKSGKYLMKFMQNLEGGINYYYDLGKVSQQKIIDAIERRVWVDELNLERSVLYKLSERIINLPEV